jgi:hypothetical protein
VSNPSPGIQHANASSLLCVFDPSHCAAFKTWQFENETIPFAFAFDPLCFPEKREKRQGRIPGDLIAGIGEAAFVEDRRVSRGSGMVLSVILASRTTPPLESRITPESHALYPGRARSQTGPAPAKNKTTRIESESGRSLRNGCGMQTSCF